MEFLYMTEDIMDPTSFLDSTADSELTDWNSPWPGDDGASNNQVVSRKRRASEIMTEVSAKNCNYKINRTAPIKQVRGKNSVICNQDRVTTNSGNGGSNNAATNNGWQPVEELGNNLSDDLDGTCSLTGLGVDLNSSSYNISDALLALPLTFKQELPSPVNNQENGGLFGNTHMSPGSGSGVIDSPQSCSPHLGHVGGNISSASNSPPHLLQMVKPTFELNVNGEQKEKGPIPVCLVIPENHQGALVDDVNSNKPNTVTNGSSDSSSNCINSANRIKLSSPSHELNSNEGPCRTSANIGNGINSSGGTNIGQNNKSLVILSSAATLTTSPPPVSSQTSTLSVAVQPSVVHHKHHHIIQQNDHNNEDCRFQYVLAAATSIATKINEETQTYLNQGQSYEIKLKKLGDLSHYRGKILKSVVRLSFHERRLQYMEGEQMAAWVAAHPTLKILEVDLPLSYGIVDVLQDRSLNTVEFLWDPTKEVGVYIKVNCISTEFTPNKHGGEKGVPFRIQVETYHHSHNSNRKLHSASCQVKVFKLKGADRKHKQDKEKILKRPPIEREKYQPSYECTILNDMPVINDANTFSASVSSSVQSSPSSDNVNNVVQPGQQTQNPSLASSGVTGGGVSAAVPPVEQPSSTVIVQSPLPACKVVQSPTTSDYNLTETTLSSTATVQQATAWLQTNRFSTFIRTFANFSGLDLLRLSCDDLVQICGLPEGIRLYNALHKASWLTLYLCIEANPDVYQALYLAALTNQELKIKIASILSVPVSQIDELFLRGPNGIHIIVTDDVVRNFKDESTYVIEVMQGHAVDCYSLLLKPAVNNGSKCTNNV